MLLLVLEGKHQHTDNDGAASWQMENAKGNFVDTKPSQLERAPQPLVLVHVTPSLAN
jgi:hypothetical protein